MSWTPSICDTGQNPDGPGSGLPWVSRATNPKVARRIARIVAQVDADAAADRAAKARATRHVRTEALPDGMGALTVETGREAITAIVADLDTAIATAKAGGDARCPGQIRADELVHRMTLGAFGAPAHPGSNPYSFTHPGTRTNPGSETSSGSGTTAPAGRSCQPEPAPRSCAPPTEGDPTGPTGPAGPRELSGGGRGAGAAGEPDDAAGDLARGRARSRGARRVRPDPRRPGPPDRPGRRPRPPHHHHLAVRPDRRHPPHRPRRRGHHPHPAHDPTGRQRDLVRPPTPSASGPAADAAPPNTAPTSTTASPMTTAGPRAPATCNPSAVTSPDERHRPDRRHPHGPTPPRPRGGQPTPVRGPRPARRRPAGALDWTTWTGRAYRHTPDPCEENPLTDQERARDRVRPGSADSSTSMPFWADPDDPDNEDGDGDPDQVHDLRKRLHDLATGCGAASPADDYDTVNRPETETATESWHFSMERDRRRRERQTQRRAAQAPQADDGRHISDLTDEPPF